MVINRFHMGMCQIPISTFMETGSQTDKWYLSFSHIVSCHTEIVCMYMRKQYSGCVRLPKRHEIRNWVQMQGALNGVIADGKVLVSQPQFW